MACLGGVLDWIRRLFSEADATTPSSTRVLMYAFAVFAMWLDWRIFYHIFHLPAGDTSSLSIWLSNMPILIGAEIGLIALPYTINKGTNTLSDVANMFATIKGGNPQVNAALSNSTVQAVLAKVIAPKTGSAGPKG